jgi:hypothetical protein
MIENELTATSPDETVSECYALVFDSDLDAKIFHDVKAVVAVGKLTDEQYKSICGVFMSQYTRSKHVEFVLEGTLQARILSDIPSGVMYCVTDDVSELRKKLPKDKQWVVEIIAFVVKAMMDVGGEIIAAVKENTASRENDVFHGSFRAQARFTDSDEFDEVEIEKIHRLRGDGWKWEDIVRKVYPETEEADIKSEIERIKKQHQREYGHSQ